MEHLRVKLLTVRVLFSGDGLGLRKRLGLAIFVVVATNAASFMYKQLYRE
jgi:hypothetical protein